VTIAGYALTAVCVPLLAVTPYLGAAGLAVAVLILAERTGKAGRQSALLAGAAQHVGMGRASATSPRPDRGPLLVAGIVASPERAVARTVLYPAPWRWCCSS
jgi:hypothetical protein